MENSDLNLIRVETSQHRQCIRTIIVSRELYYFLNVKKVLSIGVINYVDDSVDPQQDLFRK